MVRFYLDLVQESLEPTKKGTLAARWFLGLPSIGVWGSGCRTQSRPLFQVGLLALFNQQGHPFYS